MRQPLAPGSTARYLLVTAFSAAVLYGTTYQQFRFFDLERPGGAIDAVQYVRMAQGMPLTDPEVRQYRWLTPAAAGALEPLAARVTGAGELSIRLAFYVVNYSLSLLACVMVFRFLQLLGYSAVLSLLGVCAFASSRITVLVTGTPLVDAGYFCAVAIAVCTLVEAKPARVAALWPLLTFAKETILPFLALPLVTGMRKSPLAWAGMMAVPVGFYFNRAIAEMTIPSDASYAAAVIEHAGEFGTALRRLLTPSGVHDLFSSFSLLLPMSVAGAWLNARHRYHQIPFVVVASVPIALVLALLSGNFGRMIFAAFPAVIAYALIAVEHVTSPRSDS